ncbi:hypothetical protein ACFLVC_01135 [Chloroflexota bacterium]
MEAGKGVELRCRLCYDRRFVAPAFQKVVPCPKCGTKWRIRWFDEDTPLITGVIPATPKEIMERMRKEATP